MSVGHSQVAYQSSHSLVLSEKVFEFIASLDDSLTVPKKSVWVFSLDDLDWGKEGDVQIPIW